MATCDVTQLLADGRCFLCLHRKDFEIVLAQMLCNVLAAATQAASCSNLFQDPFDGPLNAELLDPPWEHPGDTFLYSAGTAIEDPGGDGSTAFASLTSMSDGYVQAKCLGTGTHMVMLRADPNSPLIYYAANLDASADTINVMRGTTSLLAINLPAPFVAGDVLRLEARGTQLTVKYNGTTLAVVSDTTASAIAGPGLAGIKGGEGLGAIFDDFESCSWD